MRDSFDFETYWWIVDRVRATNRFVRFDAFRHSDVTEPFCLLRHDVDYSTAAALRMAEREAERGIAATYFLLVNSIYYNLLAPEHAGVARRLSALGHEVGLHYDVDFFRPFPRGEWNNLITAQAALLGELAGNEVTAIAMHQPALHGEDPFAADSAGFLNASSARFTRDVTYVSDSCRAWRDTGWSMFESGPIPPRLQLALHPINWSDGDRGREAIFQAVHDDLARDIHEAGRDLLAKIAVHSGVREHEARTAREKG